MSNISVQLHLFKHAVQTPYKAKLVTTDTEIRDEVLQFCTTVIGYVHLMICV